MKKALLQPELNGFLPDGKSAEDTGGLVSQIGSVKADEVAAETYDVTGLAAGEHLFAVTGRNSRGEGPVNAVVTVRVTVAAVA